VSRFGIDFFAKFSYYGGMLELQAIVLGIIQGLTEFIPVSSSGHLIFVPVLFGWQDQGLTFDVVVHMGTLLAVIVYFRKRLWSLVTAWLRPSEESRHLKKLSVYMVLSIIPAGIIGFLFGNWIEVQLRDPKVIAYGLIFWGAVLFVAEKSSARQKNHTRTDDINLKQVIAISCAQALALIPGTSRSGITMTAGLFARLDKTSAAEFSFLMSVPVIALAGVLKIMELIQTGLGSMTVSSIAFGFVASAVSGFVAIAALMNIIKKWNFKPFVVYRIVVGILILLFVA